jgi:hypothetical protein
MSALTHYFFDSVYHPRSDWAVVEWWESRRAVYNLVVGTAGLVSLGVAIGLALLPPHPAVVRIPWSVIVVYGALANLAYTLGPLVDLAIRRRWGHRYAPIGPALFRYGFVFSVGLTLLPIPLAILSWGIRTLHALL